MTGQMCYRRLVEASSGVDVDGICDIFIRLHGFYSEWVVGFVLARRGEQQAAIGSKG